MDTYGPRLHRLARRHAACDADAEDLTQEIFVALFQSLASYRGESTLATWSYRVALNHCLKHTTKAHLATVPYDDAREQAEPPERGPVYQSTRNGKTRRTPKTCGCSLPKLAPASFC